MPPTLITNAAQFQAIGLSEVCEFGNDIDLTGFPWVPLGTGIGALRWGGILNGKGYRVIGLTLNNPTSDYQGLFGSTVGATITNIADVTGSITGKDNVGGIIGRNYTSAVSLCKCSATVSGNAYVGGLIGYNLGSISYCLALGNVTLTGGNGGALVGIIGSGSILQSYATGNTSVTGSYSGALCGYVLGGIVSSCFCSGKSTVAVNFAGGLYAACAQASSDLVTGSWLSVAEMKNPLWYIAFDWDFAATWVMPIAMPNLVGQTIAAAQNLLFAQGCTLSITSYDYHATVPAGQIITQSIAAGGTAGYPQLQAFGMPASPKTGDVVAVTVSLGAEPVTVVPSLVGDGLAEATDEIVAAHLTSTISGAFSSEVALGYVVSQDPAAGGSVSYWTNVEIVVSLGEESVPLSTMPDVVGLAEAAATVAITGAGLVAVITEAYHATIADGVVISQDVDPDTTIEAGSDIDITVSKGVEPATVPDVVEEHFVAATALIENAGLTVTKTDVYSTTVAVNFVVDQDPAADTLVAVGSAVEIEVSQGAETVPVSSGIYSRMRKQNAIYWPPATMNDFGEPVYGDLVELVLTEGGVNYRVRWEDVIENYIDAQGTVQQSTTTVYVPPLPTGDEVELNGYLWKGDLAGLTSTTDPTLNPGAEKIKQFKQIPNMKATQILRAVYL